MKILADLNNSIKLQDVIYSEGFKHSDFEKDDVGFCTVVTNATDDDKDEIEEILEKNNIQANVVM